MFTYEELTSALARERFGRPLHYFRSVGSTNDEARRLATAGAAEGTLIVADEQTAGRGRGGRRWVTPPGVALAATYVLRPALPAAQVARLSLLGGLAAAHAIEQVTGLVPKLKWPNDVLVGERKACGVLAEASVGAAPGGDRAQLEWAILGIGINVNGGPPADLAVAYPATTLAEQLGRPVARLDLLVALTRALADLYVELDGEGLQRAWSARLLWHGERVRVMTGAAGAVEGTLVGLTADGALRLRQDGDHEVVVAAGDLKLVRA